MSFVAIVLLQPGNLVGTLAAPAGILTDGTRHTHAGICMPRGRRRQLAGAAEELVGESNVAAHGAHGGAGHLRRRGRGVSAWTPDTYGGVERGERGSFMVFS